MKTKTILLATCCLVLLGTAGLARAEYELSKQQALKLLSGNTVEGKIIKWNTTYKMYLHPGGKLVRLDSRGNVEKGMWRISNQGKFCIEFHWEKCRIMKKREDGGLNFYNNAGKLKFTVDKVIPGNPNNWLP